MAKLHFEPTRRTRRAHSQGTGGFVLIGVPDHFSEYVVLAARRETTAEFKHVRGRVLKVRGFDRYGFAGALLQDFARSETLGGTELR